MNGRRSKRPRSSLARADWPASHRALWDAARKPGSLLRPGGRASKWSADTLRMCEAAYGEWLFWLRGQAPDWATAAPADLFTEERYLAFLDDMEQHVAPVSVGLRAGKIRQMVKAMLPGHDWGWLDVITCNLISRSGEGRDKRARIVHARALFEFGLRLVVRADEEPGLTPLRRATMFRDGLLIGFLANRPLRKRNVRNMVLGQTFVREGDLYWLRFPKSATKTRQPINVPCVHVLTPLFDRYLEIHRRELLKAGGTDAGAAIWISGKGRPMNDMAIWRAVTRHTLAEFGKAVNPHLFRDCVATTIAMDDPVYIQAAMVILGHTTMAMVEKHYNQASSFDAFQALQAVMADDGTGRAAARHVRPAIPVLPKVRRYGAGTGRRP